VIEEQARVASVQHDLAEIVVERQSACGGCAARSGCGTSLLSTWLPKRQLVFHLNNAIGARPGDRVVLGLDEAQLQRSSLLLYALPLVGLLFGAIGGEMAFSSLGFSAELGAVVTGLFGVVAALTYVRHLSSARFMAGDGGIRLLRVVSSSAALAPGGFDLPKVHVSERLGTSK